MSMIPLVNVLSSFRCHPQSIIHQFRISIHHFFPQLDVPKSVLSSGLTHPVVRNYSHLTHLLYLPTPFSSSMPSCQSRSLSCSLLFSASSNFQFTVHLIPSVFCIFLPFRHFTASSSSFPFLMSQHAPSSFTACPLQLHYMLTQHDLSSFTKSSFRIQ